MELLDARECFIGQRFVDGAARSMRRVSSRAPRLLCRLTKRLQTTEESSLQLKTQRMIKTRMCVPAPKQFNKTTIALSNRARSKRTQITVREQNKLRTIMPNNKFGLSGIGVRYFLCSLTVTLAKF